MKLTSSFLSFFSGIDFEGSTVGLAFVGTMCTAHSVGVVQVSRTRLYRNPGPIRSNSNQSNVLKISMNQLYMHF